MPKISTAHLRVYTEKINEVYKVDVNYSSKEQFYIKIPGNFYAPFDHLSAEDFKEFKCSKIFKTKYSSGEYIRVVTGETETAAINNASQLLKKLASDSIIERSVIVIFTEIREVNRNHYTSDGFSPVGMELGLSFCVETSVAGGEKKYYIYSEYEAFGEIRINKKQIHLWNSNSIVIDDTEENREFVVRLYEALKELKNKMQQFTKSETDFLNLIASGQKLLNGR